MGLFDGVLGGIVGAGMVTVVNGILEKHGGLQGVVSEFERNGLGPTVRSWVGTGPNDPVTAADIQRAINARPDRTAEEVATVAVIDAKLSAMEVRYARAHRLVDIGRVAEARRVANSAQSDVDGG